MHRMSTLAISQFNTTLNELFCAFISWLYFMTEQVRYYLFKCLIVNAQGEQWAITTDQTNSEPSPPTRRTVNRHHRPDEQWTVTTDQTNSEPLPPTSEPSPPTRRTVNHHHRPDEQWTITTNQTNSERSPPTRRTVPCPGQAKGGVLPAPFFHTIWRVPKTFI